MDPENLLMTTTAAAFICVYAHTITLSLYRSSSRTLMGRKLTGAQCSCHSCGPAPRLEDRPFHENRLLAKVTYLELAAYTCQQTRNLQRSLFSTPTIPQAESENAGL